ncbi:MAG: hypothetical protein GX254_06050 [Clostridiales bacterium]|jgi:hypothetical protein|nr:hypothetical protein [Clostridiales bacterium]
MAKFDDIKRQTADTAEMIAGKSIQLAKKAAEKTKQLARITVLKAEILAEKDAIRRAYCKLGKLYYEIHGKEPAEPMAETVGLIDESLKRVQEMLDKIEEIKSENKITEEDVEVEINIEIIPEEQECDNEDALNKTDEQSTVIEEEPENPV